MRTATRYSIGKYTCRVCGGTISKDRTHGVIFINGFPSHNCPRENESYQELNAELKEDLYFEVEKIELVWAKKYIRELSDQQIQSILLSKSDRMLYESDFIKNMDLPLSREMCLLRRRKAGNYLISRMISIGNMRPRQIMDIGFDAKGGVYTPFSRPRVSHKIPRPHFDPLPLCFLRGKPKAAWTTSQNPKPIKAVKAHERIARKGKPSIPGNRIARTRSGSLVQSGNLPALPQCQQ